MEVTFEIKEAIFNTEKFKSINEYCKESKCEFMFNNIENACFDKNTLTLRVNCTYILNNEKTEIIEEFEYKIGIRTKKGYFSTKKIPVFIIDNENLKENELNDLMVYYNSSTKENNFDPFWYENNLIRRNASAWSFIASNHLQDDCR